MISLIPKERRKRVYSKFIQEILKTEGFCNFTFCDVDRIHQSHLVIVYDELNKHEWTKLVNYIREGGRAVLINPSSSILRKLGIRVVKTLEEYHLVPKYVVVNQKAIELRELVDKPVQLVVNANLCSITREYNPFAYIMICDQVTNYPAFFSIKLGKGFIVVFVYDIIENIVLLRQGRKENADRDIDGDGALKPNDLFIGLLDFRLKWIPQADIHMRFLTKAIEYLLRDITPIVRLWYFPNGANCIVVMTGDSDIMEEKDLDVLNKLLTKYNIKYTLFIRPEEAYLLPKISKNITLGYHTFPGYKPKVEEAKLKIKEQIEALKEKGLTSELHRGHCTIWCGWTSMAEILSSQGVRMDLSFYPYRYIQAGYLNSSGLPMRFINDKGEIIDIFEQSTPWADDSTLVDKTFVQKYSMKRLIQDTIKTIKESYSKYHTAITFCIHPINMREEFLNSKLWFEEVVKYCINEGIPVMDAYSWFEYFIKRDKVSLKLISVKDSKFKFIVYSEHEINNLTLIISPVFKNQELKEVIFNDKVINFSTKKLCGTNYAVIVVRVKKGDNELVLKY